VRQIVRSNTQAARDRQVLERDEVVDDFLDVGARAVGVAERRTGRLRRHAISEGLNRPGGPRLYNRLVRGSSTEVFCPRFAPGLAIERGTSL
jgi:hypothetical protein